MTTLRHHLLCLFVAVPVATVGIVSVALHTAMVWPGCAVSAFLGTSAALRIADLLRQLAPCKGSTQRFEVRKLEKARWRA